MQIGFLYLGQLHKKQVEGATQQGIWEGPRRAIPVRPGRSLGTQSPKKAAEKQQTGESSEESSDESGESSPELGLGVCEE